MANGSVPGTFTTHRTMTSTAKNQTLRFSADVPGFRVTTDTPLVTFKKAGETKTVSLTFTKLTSHRKRASGRPAASPGPAPTRPGSASRSR